MSGIDYKYAFELVQKVNNSRVNGRVVSDFFVLDGINYWYFYQSSIFSEAKTFSVTRKVPTKTSLSPKGFLVSFGLCIFSLVSVVFFLIQKRRFFVFSPDTVTDRYLSDFRMKDVYEGLYENGVNFGEIFHTIPSVDTFKKIIKRRRLAIYLQSVDFLEFLFFWRRDKELKEVEIAGANKEEKEFIEYIVRKYAGLIKLSIFRVKFFTKLFSLNETKAVFLIDDTRNYNELIVASRQSGAKSWSFQHGHITKYHIGWLRQDWRGEPAKPDLFFVWSEYWKNELKRLGGYFDEKSIVVAGRGHNPKPLGKTRPEKISVLIPYETDAPKDTVREYIELFKKCGFRVYFKIRPDRDKLEQLGEYDLSSDEVIVVRNVKDVLSKILAVGGVYSTFLYDMVALEIPVFIMESDMDYGLGMVENGLASLLNKESLCDKVRQLSQIDKEELSRKRNFLVGSEGSFLKTFSDKLELFGFK